MFISKKAHNKIVDQLYRELGEAKDLQVLLKEIVNKTGIPIPPSVKGGHMFLDSEGGWGSTYFPDDVAVFVEDYFGGSVIKQEATKVVVLNEDGEASYYLTSKSPDKGRKYLLVQE